MLENPSNTVRRTLPVADDDAPKDEGAVIYSIDRCLTITSCNAAWDQFAEANDGSHLLGPKVVGRSLLEFIAGDLKAYYRELFEQLMIEGRTWQLEYDCRSATLDRKFLLTAYPSSDGLILVNSLRYEAAHSTESADLQSRYSTPDGLIVMCSNCRRSRRAGQRNVWDWVPGFVSSPPSNVSHGLCPPCYEHYTREWETESTSDAPSE